MQNISTNLKIFRALSDENRVRMLEQIHKATSSQVCDSPECTPEDACVTNLAESLDITAATASHHVKELVNAGLIITSKKGRWVYCRVNDEALSQASDFLSQLRKEDV